MGTGKNAAIDSASAVSLLERFIKSGIDPKTSLVIINSALILKTEETGSFATLDLMCVDLFSGDTDFYKYGSAPTYIKRGGHVRKIVSGALPAGITSGAQTDVDRTRLKLRNNDFIVMASDGVADAGDDTWLFNLLDEYSGKSSKKLAGDILSGAFTRYGRADDMTVMVVGIRKNG